MASAGYLGHPFGNDVGETDFNSVWYPTAHERKLGTCRCLLQRFLDRLLQRGCLSLCPCGFKWCRSCRIQVPTYLSDSFVQGISIETRGGRQVVSGPKQSARTRSLSLDGGDLSQANQPPDNAQTIFHALHVLPET